MRTPCCHTFLAFILKFLIFLQAFIGVAMIVYSTYMLNQWNHHLDPFPPPPNQSGIRLPSDVVSSHDDVLRFNFHSLPAPWFAYASLGIGILVCCIAFIGHIGTETMSGCCLFLYAAFSTIFILMEVGLVVFIALDHHWQEDIPFDPTGELDSFRTFIVENADVFKLIGIAILILQVLSLLLAIVLRSLVTSQREDDDIEEDYGYSSRNREPLLTSYPSHAPASPRGDSDIWSSRMRQKYGLTSADVKHNFLNQNTSADFIK